MFAVFLYRSLYYLHGRPLLAGLVGGHVAVFLAAIAVFSGGSLAGFARRDIAK